MLCWNRWEDVNVSLSKIAEFDYANLETIVVDNGSTDGSQKNVREQFPWVKLIEARANLGIEAYKIGFEAAKGEFIIIIDFKQVKP